MVTDLRDELAAARDLQARELLQQHLKPSITSGASQEDHTDPADDGQLTGNTASVLGSVGLQPGLEDQF